jgi:hypothetical protein
MKTLSTLVAALTIITPIAVFAADQPATNTTELIFPHEHVQKLIVKEADLPYEKAFVMKEHDAVIFILPQQRSVSVWCYRPDDFFPLAEQTTKSRLKTAWGEKPWIKPRMKHKRIGNNSYAGDGLDSYIQMGGVVTTGDLQSDYTLYVDRLKINIIEDLSATNALPVKIRVAKTNRTPLPDSSDQ